ncbi:hypothetical protein [Desulfopila aestuarii]|uniref:Uncharacterized protein n=1 Tax=Desulfopila aestuarii DSM 18488 TaxID=1121416 RepID=A0A1M7YLL2_9BACT|nr:hypothetical protein [Desulfopila aestuarii]SHO53469.1 hypothetical protein SAMN02745220_05135 [Desulfopila aestuarii DSM 18488]
MDIPDFQIINAFVDQHRLSRGQVIAEIERTFSSMLSRWHHKHVVVVYSDGQLHALGYHDDVSGPVQTPIDLTAMRGWNSIKRILDKNLNAATCMDEVSRYKRKENSVVWGEVISRGVDRLNIELELEFGDTIYASCPLNYLGQHERNRLVIGDRKAFHLRRIEAIMIGDTPRTQLTVDRVSKTLVEKLLKQLLGPKYTTLKLSCRKRYVGKKSFVEANTFVPKKVILQAAHELGEHIQVNVIKVTR